jgi:phage/plasmid-associated DNA primase
MLIQVNKKIRNMASISKVELKMLAESENRIENWSTQDTDVKALAAIISQGYSIRAGIKKTGNTEEHIESIEWLFLDLDNQSVQETLNNPWTRYACLWYYTPSYKPGVNEKHRVGFKFDLRRGKEEYEHIYKALLTFYPKADKTTGAGWLFFGAYQPSEGVDTLQTVTILNENATLPTDAFLTMDIPVDAGVSKNENGNNFNQSPLSKTDGIRTQLLKWIAKDIWLGVCGNDIDKLYCLHTHRFIEQPKGKSIAKWGGHRPEDTEKKTGTGFYVWWDNPDMPPMFQNQGNSPLGENVYTFIEYWHHYSNLLYSKNWESIVWEDDKDYKNLQIVCDDIANHFKVDFFNFDAAKNAIKDKRKKQQSSLIDSAIAEYVMEDRDSGNYLTYDLQAGKWRVIKEKSKIYNYTFKQAFLDAGVDVELAETAKFKRSVSADFDAKTPTDTTKLDFDDMHNYDWLPLANGDFNIITKEFRQGFDHTIYNQHRYKNYLYIPPASSELAPELKLFFEWLEWTYKDAATRQAVIDWLALNVMGIANHTQVMLCFWGTPGTGKSVILSLINNMMGSLCETIQGRKLKAEDNRFIFQQLDGIYALTIDEFKTNQVGWDSLKELTGSTTPIISVEKKGLQPYKTKFRGAITTASQDSFSVPNSDDGGVRRRVIPIQHTPNLRNKKYADIDETFKKSDYYKQIFYWLINNIDAGDAIKRMKAYANSNEVKQSMLDILIEQDEVLSFMYDCLEFTNNDKDVISNMDLQSAFENYLQSEKLQHLTDRDKGRVNKISQYVREKARIPDNKINWKYCPEKGKDNKVTINGKQTRGLQGIRIKYLATVDCPI